MAAVPSLTAEQERIRAFVDELAELYAHLWLTGQLDAIRQESDAEPDE